MILINPARLSFGVFFLILVQFRIGLALKVKEVKPNGSEPFGEETNSTRVNIAEELTANGYDNLQDSDRPNCTIRFRPESDFNYFDVDQIQAGVFVVPYDKGEPSEPYKGESEN